jgi:parallel beta-helix repeat protein
MEDHPMHKRGLGVLAVAGAAMALSAAPAFGATIKVGNDPSNCADAAHTTIQAGVDAAAPGDKVQVCPGTYPEQVTIPATKDGLQLESQKPLQAIIEAPPVMADVKAIVRVTGAEDVEVEKFTIRGPGGSGCDSIRYGVRVDGGGEADIRFNHITSIRDQGQSGCQNGNAIQVGRQADSTTGRAIVRFNIIDDFQKTGVIVDGAGSSAIIALNAIKGAGPVNYIAQNGVQVSRDADALVQANTISDLSYTPQTAASTGMLLFDPGKLEVSNNRVRDTDVGIYAISTDDQARIRDNDIARSVFDGITLFNATGTRVEDNESNDNAVGIGLYNTTGAKVSDNEAEDNSDVGLFADTDTSGNTFSDNKAEDNATFDCQDKSTGSGTAGTANTWSKNVGETSSPAGLCKPEKKKKKKDRDDDDDDRHKDRDDD